MRPYTTMEQVSCGTGWLGRLAVVACLALFLGHAFAQADVAPAQDKGLLLRFQDFFRSPQGAKGPQFADALLQAKGQNVRITGYMVQNERPPLGRFMLTPRPVQMSEHADGDADDLPAATLTVYLDSSQQSFAVPHVNGLIEVSGVLDVGRLEESDGRVSWVRLQLSPQATRAMNPLELANYLHALQHSH